jgi:anti-sigma B factor antagonist
VDPNFELRIDTFGAAGTVRLRVSGEVDLATAAQLEAAIGACAGESTNGTPVVLDLTAVTFIDSSGLAVVLRANDALAGRLSVAASPACERLFDIVGVRGMLPLVGGEQIAIEED